MIVIKAAANTPPAPKSVKKAIITKSRFEIKPIVFDLKVVKINPLLFNKISVNLRKVSTLNFNLRGLWQAFNCHLLRCQTRLRFEDKPRNL